MGFHHRLGRRMQQRNDGPVEDDYHQGEDHRDGGKERDGSAHRAGQLLLVALPEVEAHQHGDAGGETDDGLGNHRHHLAAHGDGRNIGRGGKVAHHKKVGGAIEVLQQHAQHVGAHKARQLAQQAARGQAGRLSQWHRA